MRKGYLWLNGVAALLAALIRPGVVLAHGDLHLRILESTRQIDAATNNKAQLYLARGELYRAHQDWKAASDDYDQAAKLDPELCGVELCRARLLADRGDLEGARSMFGQALRRNPKDGESFLGRAGVLARLGQPRAAVADAWRGLELLPHPPADAVLALGQTLESLSEIDEALRALDEGMRKLGWLASLQGYAVELEIKRQKYDAALARIETILARAPRKEAWFARRGQVYARIGKANEARDSYAAAIAAIGRLPGPLQHGPPMMKLQAEIYAGLTALTNSAATVRQ